MHGGNLRRTNRLKASKIRTGVGLAIRIDRRNIDNILINENLFVLYHMVNVVACRLLLCVKANATLLPGDHHENQVATIQIQHERFRALVSRRWAHRWSGNQITVSITKQARSQLLPKSEKK